LLKRVEPDTYGHHDVPLIIFDQLRQELAGQCNNQGVDDAAPVRVDNSGGDVWCTEVLRLANDVDLDGSGWGVDTGLADEADRYLASKKAITDWLDHYQARTLSALDARTTQLLQFEAEQHACVVAPDWHYARKALLGPNLFDVIHKNLGGLIYATVCGAKVGDYDRTFDQLQMVVSVENSIVRDLHVAPRRHKLVGVDLDSNTEPAQLLIWAARDGWAVARSDGSGTAVITHLTDTTSNEETLNTALRTVEDLAGILSEKVEHLELNQELSELLQCQNR
jgi:hypothetical protein